MADGTVLSLRLIPFGSNLRKMLIFENLRMPENVSLTP